MNTLKSCICNKIKKVLESGIDDCGKISNIRDINLFTNAKPFFVICNSALLHVIVLMKNPLLFAAHHGIIRVGEEFGETGGKVTHKLVRNRSQ